ncbi:SDR family NAD(P)-dependent oxidoreductase [Novosphingobium bradum]|uniref:SDR family NAD(P)-dependent oxidoreductase n=1 Tax=Novosphingobium bradum TaxID=1737444 RepID=A0ABV7IM93_9SPHN
MRFEGKVAIVTGAAQGIGATYARRLAAEGARVVVSDIKEEGARAVVEEIIAAGGEAIFLPVDVSDEASCLALAQAAKAHFGRIDCLINNAGIFAGMRYEPMMTVDMAYFDRIIAVNFRGTLLVIRAVAPIMAETGGGSIVNQSSITSHAIGPRAGYYAISKLAVNGLTAGLALELGASNIRVNGVAPGQTETPALEDMRATVSEEVLKKVYADMPIKRPGTTDEQANAALFLLSDEASYITGETLFVDGGRIRRI